MIRIIITPDLLGDPDEIQKNYYESQITRLPQNERLKARRLVEEGLIYAEEKRRISLYESQIYREYELEEETLRQLVNNHLLRAEPDPKGGYNYELSHDTLVEPILEAYEIRQIAERKAEETRIEQERKAKEARRRKRFYRTLALILLGLALIIALALYLIAEANALINQSKKAEARAVQMETQAQTNLKKANQATRTADEARQQADKNLRNARTAKAEAQRNLLEAKRAKTQAANEKKNALVQLSNALSLQLEIWGKALTENRHSLDEARYGEVQKLLREIGAGIAKVKEQRASNATYQQIWRREPKLLDWLDDLSQRVVRQWAELALVYTAQEDLDQAQESLAQIRELRSFPMERLSRLQSNLPAYRQALHRELRKALGTYHDTLYALYYPHMQSIPAGGFQMGTDSGTVYQYQIEARGEEERRTSDDLDEHPTHSISLEAYQLGRTEVTVRQFRLYLQAKGNNLSDLDTPPGGWQADDPMAYVAWYEKDYVANAIEYCNWLSEQEGRKPCYSFLNTTGVNSLNWKIYCDFQADGYRLPTEAEWECAARGGAGETGKNYVFSGSNVLYEVAWTEHNSSNQAQPVAQLEPNALGLYDMIGNVWEWCQDEYKSYIERPNLAQQGLRGSDEEFSYNSQRISRGGSWKDSDINKVRLSNRLSFNPDNHSEESGFRVSRIILQ